MQAGAANALSLIIANRKPGPITFTAGTLVPEGNDAKGSIFYAHFGSLVAAADVAKIAFAAADWSFRQITDQRYGAYWAATPTKDKTIPPGGHIAIAVTGLTPSSGVVQAQIYFNYYDLQGSSDGVSIELLSIQGKS